MGVIDKISNALYKITGVLITTSMFVIVILTFVQVISRFVFRFSIQWSQELIIYLMMWLVFLGCSMGIRDHEVASLTIVTGRLSPKMQLIFEIITDVVLIWFCIVAIYGNHELIQLSLMRKSSVMKINMAFSTTAFSAGMVMVTFYSVIELIKDIGKMIRKDYSIERKEDAE